MLVTSPADCCGGGGLGLSARRMRRKSVLQRRRSNFARQVDVEKESLVYESWLMLPISQIYGVLRSKARADPE